jgi:hypothetical protein
VPVLKKCVHLFWHFTHGHLILVRGFGLGKVHFKNNCVWFWVWVKIHFFLLNVTLLCVVVCGDRGGSTHWNVLIMFFLGMVLSSFSQKPNSKKEEDCLVKSGTNIFSCAK